MSAVSVVIILGGIVVVGLLAVVGLILLLPAASAALERARIEREAADASWKIHQAATVAFARMLDQHRQAREES